MTDSLTVQFLASLGLTTYVDSFAKQEIDYHALLRLTGDDLTELGLPLGPKGKILDALEALRLNFSDDPWAPNPLRLSQPLDENFLLYSSEESQPYIRAEKPPLESSPPLFLGDRPAVFKPDFSLELSLAEDEEIVESIPLDDDIVLSVPLVESPRPTHHSAPFLGRLGGLPDARSASPSKPISAPTITRPDAPAPGGHSSASSSPHRRAPGVLLKSELGRAKADRDLLPATHRTRTAATATSPRPEALAGQRPDNQRPDHGRASLTRARPTALPVPALERPASPRPQSPQPQPQRATSPSPAKTQPATKTSAPQPASKARVTPDKTKTDPSVAGRPLSPAPASPKAKLELSVAGGQLSPAPGHPLSPEPASRPPYVSLPRLQSVYHDVMPSPEADPEEPEAVSYWPPFDEFDH